MEEGTVGPVAAACFGDLCGARFCRNGIVFFFELAMQEVVVEYMDEHVGHGVGSALFKDACPLSHRERTSSAAVILDSIRNMQSGQDTLICQSRKRPRHFD